jgi:hypothetical protein
VSNIEERIGDLKRFWKSSPSEDGVDGLFGWLAADLRDLGRSLEGRDEEISPKEIRSTLQ